MLWVFCFIFKCVSSLPTDVFCQFYFSNGFVGKSKWSLTLISVFTVPIRARDVLHNHQHAVKDLTKAMSAQNSKRSLQNLGLSLCRVVRLCLHTLSQRKPVSRNEKKVSSRVKKFLKAVSASFFRIISNQLCQVKLLLLRKNTWVTTKG